MVGPVTVGLVLVGPVLVGPVPVGLVPVGPVRGSSGNYLGIENRFCYPKSIVYNFLDFVLTSESIFPTNV